MAPTIPDWVYTEISDELAAELPRAETLLRDPDEVMSQAALNAMTASRLSFTRTLARRMTRNRWRIELTVCEIDADSTGFLGYEIHAEDMRLSFGVFVYPPFPPGTQRLFRDTTTEFLGILLEGPIDRGRLRREKQQFDEHVWRGRTDPTVLGWTVASRGTRTFDEVVDALTTGRQPDVTSLDANGGYLIRNGGFYGNGRMGTRAWPTYAASDGPFSTPYHVDLFSLYLWRLVSLDLADATARARSSDAVPLEPAIRRHLGIGNSSGLGTVAALIRWPARLSAFVLARELAFAYVKARPAPIEPERIERMHRLLHNAAAAYSTAPIAPAELLEPRDTVAAALRAAGDKLTALETGERPWQTFIDSLSELGSREAVEVAHALLLELYPEVDELEHVLSVAAVHRPTVDPGATVGSVRALIEQQYDWLLAEDMAAPGHREFFWYRSEENGENRRGERSVDIGVERETFVDVAGTVRRLYDFVRGLPPDTPVAQFLVEEPEHALAVTRVQLAGRAPYSEIRARVCGTDFLASAGIRCFLSLLGIELSTPHNGRWVRGLFFRGAPLPEDLLAGGVDEGGIGAEPAAGPVDELVDAALTSGPVTR
ncbi:hypothetical protein [Streptomyces carpinensis]|uniref:Uncharacterized protein n=1 Tax=Streptomyces carpinensis TaxID=66369 RepID=A0ABV1W175_9ACTN|nr:hypothetical protein [Streptomyces carpinensis]